MKDKEPTLSGVDERQWIAELGGQRAAVMWFADFACYMGWQELRFACLSLMRKSKYELKKSRSHVAKSKSKPDVEDQARIDREFEKQCTAIESVFPSLSGLAHHSEEQLAKLFESLKAASEDTFVGFIDFARATGTLRKGLNADVLRDSFIRFLEKISIKNSQEKWLVSSSGQLNTRMLMQAASAKDHDIWLKIAPTMSWDEIRYCIAWSIRRRCGAELDSDTARIIQQSCDKIADSKQDHKAATVVLSLSGVSHCPFDAEPSLGSIKRSGIFLSYLLLLGDCEYTGHAFNFLSNSLNVDAEYVLSLLFGFPLVGKGINELFGGGGIFFYDQTHVNSAHRESESHSMPGRIVLVRGGYGTGKTSLGLTMAASVARLGGLAVYFAMEFDEQQAYFNLERLGLSTSGLGFKIFTDPKKVTNHFIRRRKLSAEEYLTAMDGAILLVAVAPDVKNPIHGRTLFEMIQTVASSRLPVFPRVIVVDSLNAISNRILEDIEKGESTSSQGQANSLQAGEDLLTSGDKVSRRNKPELDDPALRRLVLNELRKSTNLGTNIVLLSEEDDKTWTSFGEDISDTVIRLSGPNDNRPSVDFDRLGMTTRTMVVTKSRYQKEHPGFHPFEITSGRGFQVSLSTEANAAILSRREGGQVYPAKFGIPKLDEILEGDNQSPNCGGVVFLEGELGTYKTQFGLEFLKSQDDPIVDKDKGEYGVGLIISMRYTQEEISKKLMERVFTDQPTKEFNLHGGRCVESCHIPSGKVYPDEIFKSIRKKLEDSRTKTQHVHRVLLDNPGEWEDLCPLLAGDPLWAVTLVKLLKSFGVRILVTNRQIAPKDSRFIRAILEQVDTSISLGRRVLAGERVNTIQINRSPNMNHRTAVYRMDRKPLSFETIDPLMYDADGNIRPMEVRIVRRRQTRLSDKYWNALETIIHSVIPAKVYFQENGSFGHRFPYELSNSLKLNSLTVVEIDEFELEDAVHYLADLPSTSGKWQYAQRFCSRLEEISDAAGVESGTYRAVPFFDNSSCLLIDKSHGLQSLLDSEVTWDGILHASAEYYDGQPSVESKDAAPFFSFPMGEAENWNCLFLEILAATSPDFVLAKLEPGAIREKVAFRTLASEGCTNAKISEAFVDSSIIYHRLLHREYSRQLSIGSGLAGAKYDVSHTNAVVSRHWFTTLRQTIEEVRSLSDDDRNSGRLHGIQDLVIRRLPQHVSVSGEWYLGILAKSIGIEAGSKLVQYIAGKNADGDRFRLGVGLPVIELSELSPSRIGPITGCFDTDFFLNGAGPEIRTICRSRIADYRNLSGMLSFALKQLVRLPQPNKAAIEDVWQRFLGAAKQ